MLWTLTFQELAQHTKDASLQHDTLDSTFVFYETTKAQLNVYQVCTFISILAMPKAWFNVISALVIAELIFIVQSSLKLCG